MIYEFPEPDLPIAKPNSKYRHRDPSVRLRLFGQGRHLRHIRDGPVARVVGHECELLVPFDV